MALKNSAFVFVRKTSNDRRGRPNLRTDMKRVTNLKSLGFTWKKWQVYWEFPQVFDPHVSAIIRFVVDGAAKLVLVSVAVETNDSPEPTL